MVIDIVLLGHGHGACFDRTINKLLHNLVGCGATKLWSQYAVRKDSYCKASVSIDGSLLWQASKISSIISL